MSAGGASYFKPHFAERVSGVGFSGVSANVYEYV
jgi:hypothetical protein